MTRKERWNGVSQRAPDVTNISCNKTIIISSYLYDWKTRIAKIFHCRISGEKKTNWCDCMASKEKKWPPIWNLFICEDALVYFLDIIVIYAILRVEQLFVFFGCWFCWKKFKKKKINYKRKINNVRCGPADATEQDRDPVLQPM